MLNKIKHVVQGIEDSFDYRSGKLSAAECVNRLFHDVYKETHSVVSGERKSEKMNARISGWASTKPEIESRFGVTPHYDRSLTLMTRPVSFNNFKGVIGWIESLVREEERNEVIILVMHMLMRCKG